MNKQLLMVGVIRHKGSYPKNLKKDAVVGDT